MPTLWLPMECMAMRYTGITFALQNLLMFLPFYLFLILRGFTATMVDGQLLPNHLPSMDSKALACGSHGLNMVNHNRIWDGDVDSTLFPLEEGQNSASVISEVAGQFSVDRLPYGTARLSFSAFTYIVPVTPGPKFVRLHFYNSAYKNDTFDVSKALITVKASEYTLLSNFSVSLTADALDQQNIVVKEFSLAVEKSPLKITFAPSSSNSDAFAFINGIEVVSIPDNLYYTESGNQGLTFAGQESSYYFRNNTALAMMYRFNIGGKAYSPNEDSGMYRDWKQEGFYYLTIVGSSVTIVTDKKINFTAKFPAYTAPEGVYTTAMSMGHANRSIVLSYKLTWEFPVHSGFDYLVRLHFCEIDPDVNATSFRVFRIFIADKMVESTADVFWWSGGQYIPFLKDYIVRIDGSEDEKEPKLSVALQAIPDGAISKHADAILNGIEIFKLNNTVGNLAGPNPDPVHRISPNFPSPTQQENAKANATAIIGIVAGVASGVLLLFVFGFFIFRHGRKVKHSGSSGGTTWWGPFSFTTNKSPKTQLSSSLPSDLCRYFSLAEIKAATNNFEDILIIGVGGFGNVYKGYIDDGTTPVAIKRLKSESSQGVQEFKTEIEMLSHLRHRHLVSLIGYCNEESEMILVYDYMARGTLRDHLYNTENPPLTWKQRLEICTGAARGLHYLHTGAKYTIIHRDVKTTNILLDEKWVAKVSDFGISKMGPTTMSKAHVSTVVKGSIGYLDPEYYRRQQLSEKSDIYSFGVVLCEVLSGRPPIMRNAEKGKVNLAEWAQSSYRQGKFHQIIDTHLTGKIAPECLKKYSEIAVNCLHDNGTERPSMNDIVWGLEFAMQLQQNAEDNDRVVEATMEAKADKEVAFLNNNNASDGTFSSWEHTSELEASGTTKFSSSEQGSTTNGSIKIMSGAVFSEINDPKAR